MGMRPMDPDERRCFDRLVQWEARFDAVMNVYDKTKSYAHVAPERVEEARGLYKALKQDLDAEFTRLNRTPRTAAEDRWYAHTVQEAHAHLSARTTAPEHWHADLYTSLGDITTSLSQMRSYFGLTKDA